jgi:AcrR family transcriptional regulator
MNAARTARERARAELTREITDTARRQLAESGAEGLSLRKVARELGLASSAIYRYFPSRDELLTALIVQAYDALGEAAEQAAGGSDGEVARWQAACAAVRGWALAHPREYALIYGSPVVGYQAPRTTVAPAVRVPLALLGVIRDAWRAGRLRLTDPADPELTPVLREQLHELSGTLAPELPDAALGRLLVAWTQLFGMIGFELFGQLVGSVDPSEEFFTWTTARMATFVGLD